MLYSVTNLTSNAVSQLLMVSHCHCRCRHSRPPHQQPPGLDRRGRHQDARGDAQGAGGVAAEGEVARGQLAARRLWPADVPPDQPQVRGLPEQRPVSCRQEIPGGVRQEEVAKKVPTQVHSEEKVSALQNFVIVLCSFLLWIAHDYKEK